jgi:zinc transporter 13
MLDNAETTWFHWTAAILGSFIVGLSGLVPLLINNPNKSSASSDTSKSKSLNRQLSFAVGGLLGNVFLHLIPEAYGSASKCNHDF